MWLCSTHDPVSSLPKLTLFVLIHVSQKRFMSHKLGLWGLFWKDSISVVGSWRDKVLPVRWPGSPTWRMSWKYFWIITGDSIANTVTKAYNLKYFVIISCDNVVKVYSMATNHTVEPCPKRVLPFYVYESLTSFESRPNPLQIWGSRKYANDFNVIQGS